MRGGEVDGFFRTGVPVDEVVVVNEDGFEKGGPISGVDLGVPAVDLSVSAKSPESVELGFQAIGVIEEVGVVGGEEAGPIRKGEADLDDLCLAETFPEGAGAVEAADAVGLGLGEDGAVGVVVPEVLPEFAFEGFLAGLLAGGGVTEDGAFVVGVTFEVEDLRALFLKGVKEFCFPATGESGENDEGWLFAGEDVFQVGDEPLAPGFVSAFDDTGAPSDGTEDEGHRLGAEVAAPAVDEGGVVPGFVGEISLEVMVDVFGDEGGAEATGGEGVLGVEEPDVVPLLVREDGEVDGTGKVVLPEFGWCADVDDLVELIEIEWEADTFRQFHLLEDLDHEADFDGNAEGEGGDSDGGAGVPAGFTEDFDEEVGGTVDDLGVGGEIGFGVDVSAEADDFFNSAQASHFGLDDGEAGEERGFCGCLCGFDVALRGDFSFEGLLSNDGEASGDVEEVSGADAVDVRAHRRGGFGKGETEFGNFFFRSHRMRDLFWCGCW